MSAAFDEMVTFAQGVLRGLVKPRFANSAEHYILTVAPPLLKDVGDADPLCWLKGYPAAVQHVVDDGAVQQHVVYSRTDCDAFDGLKHLAAVVLAKGESLTPSLAAFICALLQGEIDRPKNSGGRPNAMADYYAYWWAIRSVQREFGLINAVGYDGVVTGSAAEVVKEAAKREGLMPSENGVIHAYKYMVKQLSNTRLSK